MAAPGVSGPATVTILNHINHPAPKRKSGGLSLRSTGTLGGPDVLNHIAGKRPDVVFAFGPNNSFFIYWSGRMAHHNCSEAFRKTVPPRLGKPFSVSLGPGPDDYCAFYQTKEGNLWYSLNFPNTSNLQFLYQWMPQHLKAHPELVPKSCFAYGPPLTPGCPPFFAGVYEEDRTASNTPSSFRKTLTNEAFDCTHDEHCPVEVSLGFGDCWWARFNDGIVEWKVSELRMPWSKSRNKPKYYESVTKLHGFMKSMDYLAFDPFDERYWFAVVGGKIHYELDSERARLVKAFLDGANIVPAAPATASNVQSTINAASPPATSGNTGAGMSSPPSYDQAMNSPPGAPGSQRGQKQG